MLVTPDSHYHLQYMTLPPWPPAHLYIASNHPVPHTSTFDSISEPSDSQQSPPLQSNPAEPHPFPSPCRNTWFSQHLVCYPDSHAAVSVSLMPSWASGSFWQLLRTVCGFMKQCCRCPQNNLSHTFHTHFPSEPLTADTYFLTLKNWGAF